MLILSLNVALFEDNNAKLANFIQNQNPDFVCFQEVTRRIDTTAFENFISKDSIDKVTPNLHSSFFAPLWACKEFYKEKFHGKEEFYFDLGGFLEMGNYIKSKFPIYTGKNIFVQNQFTHITDWSNWPEEDYRAVQVVDVSLEKRKKLRLINYHGIWTKDKQGSQKTLQACQIIKDLADEVDYPVIICGDFNLFPDTGSISVLKENYRCLVDEYKIDTTRPKSNELSNLSRNVVDYIFVSKGIKVKSFKVVETDVSDHLPLLLDFDIEI